MATNTQKLRKKLTRKRAKSYVNAAHDTAPAVRNAKATRAYKKIASRVLRKAGVVTAGSPKKSKAATKKALTKEGHASMRAQWRKEEARVKKRQLKRKNPATAATRNKRKAK